MKILYIFSDGSKTYSSHENAMLEPRADLVKGINLDGLSDEAIDLLRTNLDDDVILNSLLAEIDQTV